MSIEKSEAVILKSFNWSESSRTVVFFTLNFGRLALVDKGGRSLKTKRGRLIPFSRMEITFYHSEKESRGYISDAELLEPFSMEKDGSLGRLAYSSAACELLLKLLPEEQPQNQLYHYLINFLKHMEKDDKKYLPAVFIAFYLRLLSQLGYHPSLAYCASCGNDIDKTITGNQIFFDVRKGGIICATCQKPTDDYISFPKETYKLLLALQTASLNEAATLPIGYKKAALLLEILTKFIGNQTGDIINLNSLEFIEKLKNGQQ